VERKSREEELIYTFMETDGTSIIMKDPMICIWQDGNSGK
jgi:hypothetical protein